MNEYCKAKSGLPISWTKITECPHRSQSESSSGSDMRQIVFLIFLLDLDMSTEGGFRSFTRDVQKEQVYRYFRTKKSVVQLDFKTPNLGFLPFDKTNKDIIWSVYHLYIFFKGLSHIHHHGRL